MLRLLCATAAGVLACAASAADLHHPLDLRLPGGATVENCADPTVLKGQRPGDPPWTLICTQDPLNEADRDPKGQLRFRRLPMFRSDDLLHWQYVGDAFDAPPPQAQADAGIW
ncbi:MAG: arabinan endo-1,5-alpha-L-arabinosidase, partial [Microbacteriaceae bacterium]|nr:arabinan endo-1,5-alpha-L-arabinosidase [Burkholderiaceae bacterium]